MRQFTIAERLIAAALLPLATLVAIYLAVGAFAPVLGETLSGYVEIGAAVVALGLAGGTAWLIARSIAAPLTDIAESLDAMACAELGSAPPLAMSRGELAHLSAAADRLAEVLGER